MQSGTMGSDQNKRKTVHGSRSLRLVLAFVGGGLISLYLRRKRPLGGYRLWNKNPNDCVVAMGTYKGPVYTTDATIGPPQCLLESKFLKVQQHRVQLEKGSSIIPDWIWIDYHDRINVLIEASPVPPSPASKDKKEEQEPRFIVFQQTKYALEGRMSLAVTGGLIEPGEEPQDAARREVLEETGHVCAAWHFLGRYRTDVNRGVGWTNTFLARDCQKKALETAGADQNEVVGGIDMERQDMRIISLTELQKAVQDGQFLEIQWTATVALAVLHYNTR
jgi:8-oxo-dGTP pyrophosphatase MutT (NUDIX family)